MGEDFIKETALMHVGNQVLLETLEQAEEQEKRLLERMHALEKIVKLKDEEQVLLESKTASLVKEIIKLKEYAKIKDIEKVDMLKREET